jgi:hypothetical protein
MGIDPHGVKHLRVAYKKELGSIDANVLGAQIKDVAKQFAPAKK